MLLPARLRHILPAPLLPAEKVLFRRELYRQTSRFAIPTGLLLSVVWLGYIPLDNTLHPDTRIVIMRLLLSAMGVGLLVVRFFTRNEMILAYAVYAVGAYIICAALIIAILTGWDQLYVSGFGFVFVISYIVPAPNRVGIPVGVVCAALMIAGYVVTPFDADPGRNTYAVNNALALFAVTSAFLLIMNTVRRQAFSTERDLDRRTRETEAARRETDALSAFSRRINQTTDIEVVLDEVFAYLQRSTERGP